MDDYEITEIENEYQEGLKLLDQSGLVEGFEYVLRKLCADGLPNNNFYDLCAVYLLQYETLIKDKETKTKDLKTLVEETMDNKKKKTNQVETPTDAININEGIENALKFLNTENYLPKNKMNLKTKELVMTNFNIEIDNEQTKLNRRNFPEDKIELKSVKFLPNKKTEIKTFKNEEDKNNYQQASFCNLSIQEELNNLKLTCPSRADYSHTKLESFEIEVDLVNHLTDSGNLQKLDFNIFSKPVDIKPKEEIKTIEFEESNLEPVIEKNLEM